jgi:Ca2+-binding RTX toxin-like protein
MKRAWIAAVSVVAGIGLAQQSHAATVSGSLGFDGTGETWTLRVVAAPGEANRIAVRYLGGDIRVEDSVPMTAGTDCTALTDGSVTCQQARYTSGSIEVDAGDRNDLVQVDTTEIPAALSGGAGDDVLRANGDRNAIFRFFGGDGDDRMTGGLSTDLFLEGPAANGSDVFTGGIGDQPYADRVSYEERFLPVHADLQGDADDGERGERDRIRADVDSIVGGLAGDTLVGNALPNVLWANAGDDRLRGGRGPDRLTSGDGRDRLVPGRGRDSVDCGRGLDTVLRDAFDTLRRNCERRRS